MSNDWRSGMEMGADLRTEAAMQVVNEAYQNIKLTMEAEWDGAIGLGRLRGGLDRSAAQLAELLGIQYERTYYDDGCELTVSEMGEDGKRHEYDGHDGEEGCEEREDGENGEDGEDGE